MFDFIRHEKNWENSIELDYINIELLKMNDKITLAECLCKFITKKNGNIICQGWLDIIQDVLDIKWQIKQSNTNNNDNNSNYDCYDSVQNDQYD